MNWTRIASTLVLLPLAVSALLFLQTPYVAAIAAAVFLLGLWEWSRLIGVEGSLWRALYLMINVSLMLALLWGHGLPLFGPVILIGVVWWLLATLWLAFPDLGRENNWRTRLVKLMAGTLSIVPAWCALVLLHFGDPNGEHPNPEGPEWILLALAIVWAADMCAYVFGVNFGKRKLVPRISPGKTWMGLWGGIGGALAVGLAGAAWMIQRRHDGVGVTRDEMTAMAELILLTVVASVVGDLFESLMKRHSGCKDSGTLIPGHGGVLDRIDSVLAALPVLWVAKGWLGL